MPVIDVMMLANQPEPKVRPVYVPMQSISGRTMDTNYVLGRVFEYGQNEFCDEPEITSTTCSVSVGDVIHYKNTFYLIKSTGFKEMTLLEYTNYVALPRRERYKEYNTSE